MVNAIELGMNLYREIEAKRINGRWTWEKYVYGPLSAEDVRAICKVAGCWANESRAGAGEQIRFYTNQNHEMHGGAPW